MSDTAMWLRSGVACCLAVAFVSAGATAQERSAQLRVDQDPTALAAELEVAIPDIMKRGHVPGVSVAVVRGGRIVWEGAFGVKDVETGEPVTKTTLFEAASLTKPLFAFAAMLLIEDGVVDLDTPLLEYLPAEAVEAFITHPLDAEGFRRDWLERVTARHVLSHSSGMPHGERPNPNYPLFFEPGTQFKYSAGGYYLLQKALEHLTGKPLEDIAQEYVFGPLGMVRSSMVWRDGFEAKVAHGHGLLGTPEPFRKYRRAHAAASMYTTAGDYARFVSAVINDELLPSAQMGAMLTPQIEVDDHNTWSLGFGIQRDANGDAFWQWGDYGIFRNFVIAYKEAKTAVVYLTNSYYGLSIGSEMVIRTVGGHVHALDFLGYARYDAPATQFTWAVLEKGADVALARLPEFRANDPEAMSENDVNRLGYAFLNADRHDDAIAVFEHNVREHPTSANTYDSLAEAFMTRDGDGDVEKAIHYYRKSLETIPFDPRPDKDFLERLKEGAERQIRELEEKRRTYPDRSE